MSLPPRFCITSATQIIYSLPVLIYCRLLGGIVKQFKLSILQQPVKNISQNLKKNVREEFTK